MANQQATKQKIKPAAIFLIIVTVLIILALVVGIWIRSDPAAALRIAFTPSVNFEDDVPEPRRDYQLDTSWAALPSKASHAKGKPQGIMDIAVMPDADVFFIHPTTYLDRNHWNAPANYADANDRIANRVLKAQASAFNAAGQIFAPHYRQATFGAFFDTQDNGQKAIDLAYTDILAAFDNFIANRSMGRPFILAGHSQGSLHLLHLLRDRISGTLFQKRMIAAYIVGWPVSIEADLGAFPDIAACEQAFDTGCIISYQTFGKGGEPLFPQQYMETTNGLTGAPRSGTQMLCTNPQNWQIDGEKTRADHLGAIQLPEDPTAPLGAPVPNLTGSECGTDGVLYATDPLGDYWQGYKMAGENYHVYDYHMFYMHIRENASLRSRNWLQSHAEQRTEPQSVSTIP